MKSFGTRETPIDVFFEPDSFPCVKIPVPPGPINDSFALVEEAIEALCGEFDSGPLCRAGHQQLRFKNGTLACSEFVADPTRRGWTVMVLVFHGPAPVDSALALMEVPTGAKETMH